MHTDEELQTVWKLFNLLQELSNILFDRYQDYLMERHLDEDDILGLEQYLQDLVHKQYKQSENLPNDPK